MVVEAAVEGLHPYQKVEEGEEVVVVVEEVIEKKNAEVMTSHFLVVMEALEVVAEVAAEP